MDISNEEEFNFTYIVSKKWVENNETKIKSIFTHKADFVTAKTEVCSTKVTNVITEEKAIWCAIQINSLI